MLNFQDFRRFLFLGSLNLKLVEEAKDVPIPSYEIQFTNIMKEQNIDFSINVQDDFTRIMLGTEPVEQIWSEIKAEI